MKIIAKDLKVGMEIQTSPGHCMKILSVELTTFKSSGNVKVISKGITRNFTRRGSVYSCPNTISKKGDSMIDISFPNKPK